MTPFDVTAEIQPGITILEASAGTGKTYAVASLVTRAVALGTPLSKILVVTFTRKATGTLRERVWSRLTEVAAALERAPHPEEIDELVSFLRSGAPPEVLGRHRHLTNALADFDAATIATTHGFCQQVLAGLGVVGESERGTEMIDDVRDLVDDVVDDLFVRRFHGGSEELLLTPDDVRDVARAVMQNPDAEIAEVDRDDARDVLRRRFATTLRDRIRERKRAGRLITYDDLLERLHESIDGPLGGIVEQRLRDRFTMAVVDEFQDTDAVQWRILNRAFGGGKSQLVLVGDPKQAIYAFRGGDVHAYLSAAATADHQHSLDVSWRADQALLDALDAVFDGASLGDSLIRHTKVQARPGAEARRLVGPSAGAPVRVRIVETDNPALATRGARLKVGVARPFVASDVAAVVAGLLSGGNEVVERDSAGIVTTTRRVSVTDIAVLVRTKAFAEQVRDALATAHIRAVVHGGSSVLTTEAAGHWLSLLKALDRLAVTTVLHGVATGPFVGWSIAEVATADEDRWEALREELHGWATAFRLRGVASMTRRLSTTSHLAQRLLSQIGGERLLSDIQHVAELLHEQQSTTPGTLTTLTSWLADEITKAREADTEQGRRRLASDADAVAVMTIHAAKGLEFPIVLLPSLWEGNRENPEDVPIYHHPTDGVRCIGVGAGKPGTRLHREQLSISRAEAASEELRLLYVAMTRARHQVIAWWATGTDSERSALGRILCAGRDLDGTAQFLSSPPRHSAVRDALEQRAALHPGTIDVEIATATPGADPSPGTDRGDGVTLDVRRFSRSFDTAWVRTSYSALTSAAHDAGPKGGFDLAEIDRTPLVDEPRVEEPSPVEVAPAMALPLGELAGGARFGSLVHEILERSDFAATDLNAELEREAGRAGAARLLGDDSAALVPGVVAALSTPLGDLFDHRDLRSFGRSDRLDELGFDLPLGGGDVPTAIVSMEGIADLCSRHIPDDEPLGAYHDRLRDPVMANEFRGFLTGSIDLVARVGGHDGRHVVVDYKTNRLAPMGVTLTVDHYRPDALATAMQDAHYPLQALLYSVALHRFLRWRLAGYEPDRHLGGVAYLFLRGMTGRAANGAGVFSWKPSSALVLGLSDLLDRGAT